MSDDDFVPEEIEAECTQCHEALAAVDRLLKPPLAMSRSHLEEKLSPLDSASLTLLLAYTMNSLFWVYLTTRGIDPKGHDIKGELERIQKMMKRSKSASDRQKPAEPGTRVNRKAAERFIRAGLWDQNASEDSSSSDRKRKHPPAEISSDTPSTSKRFHSN